MCHLPVRWQHHIISTSGAACSDSQPLGLQSGWLQHPSSCCHDLKQYLALYKLQGNGGNLPALATVLAGMLCFELVPAEHLQCRELHHQTPFSSFCPCLAPSQGSLSTAALLEKGINSLWVGAATGLTLLQLQGWLLLQRMLEQPSTSHTVVQHPPRDTILWKKLGFTARGRGGAGRASRGMAQQRRQAPNCTSDSEAVVCKDMGANCGLQWQACRGVEGKELRCSLLV